MNLASQYVTTKTSKKRPFDKEEIMDTLIAPPLNIDINNIFETPITVGVRMSKTEYMEKKVGATILHKFDAQPSCKDDMIIFMPSEDNE